MNQVILDYYRCPERYADLALAGELWGSPGYFRFGKDAVCYGQCSSSLLARYPINRLYDAFEDVKIDGLTVRLPFNPSQVVENLRRERYVSDSYGERSWITEHELVKKAYYSLRPLLFLPLRKQLQRAYLAGWNKIAFPAWPVDVSVERILENLLLWLLKTRSADRIPFIWFWPEGYPTCGMITHDVETSSGRDFCSSLMDIDDSFGVKSSFQLIPQGRYAVSDGFLSSIRGRGFEINVHDLVHDGKLFRDRAKFLRWAEQINEHAKQYGAVGFRSGTMFRNPEWYDAFSFSYDMSIPNVGHLEPQRGGCCTIMPYFIGNILELPLTTAQDYSLFHILGDYSIELWKRQVTLIGENHGLASFIIHPDYIAEKRARATYAALLEYLAQLRSAGEMWIALPREVDTWWRQRSQMRLVAEGGRWRIEGPGKERARIAHATLAGDKVLYSIEPA